MPDFDSVFWAVNGLKRLCCFQCPSLACLGWAVNWAAAGHHPVPQLYLGVHCVVSCQHRWDRHGLLLLLHTSLEHLPQSEYFLLQAGLRLCCHGQRDLWSEAKKPWAKVEEKVSHFLAMPYLMPVLGLQMALREKAANDPCPWLKWHVYCDLDESCARSYLGNQLSVDGGSHQSMWTFPRTGMEGGKKWVKWKRGNKI